jgi:hypothetical protein
MTPGAVTLPVGGALLSGGAAPRPLGKEVGTGGTVETGITAVTRVADDAGVATASRVTDTDAAGALPPHALRTTAQTTSPTADPATRNRCATMWGPNPRAGVESTRKKREEFVVLSVGSAAAVARNVASGYRFRGGLSPT